MQPPRVQKNYQLKIILRHVPLFTVPEPAAASEHLLEFGEAFLGETLVRIPRAGGCGGILMDLEVEMLAFGETAVWVECDLCGRAFGEPGLTKAIVAVGHVNVCVD